MTVGRPCQEVDSVRSVLLQSLDRVVVSIEDDPDHRRRFEPLQLPHPRPTMWRGATGLETPRKIPLAPGVSPQALSQSAAPLNCSPNQLFNLVQVFRRIADAIQVQR